MDRANLGRQTLNEFQQFVTPDDGRKFTELYNVQHLTAATPSTRSAGSCITTIQRLYSMLRGEETLTRRPRRARCSRSAARSIQEPPKEVAYNPTHPDRDVRLHRHRRVPPLDLQPVAAGAGILRRLPHRPDRHAVQADHRLLQPEPRDGIHPRAGRGRRRQRRTTTSTASSTQITERRRTGGDGLLRRIGATG